MSVGGPSREQYWFDVKKQVHALFHGGGGGMQAAADATARHVEAAASAEGLDEETVARLGQDARREVLGSMRAATAKPFAKEHLGQVGGTTTTGCR